MSSPVDRAAELAELTGRVTAHVSTLAGEIGERNVWHPSRLQAAADYIRSEWIKQGHDVTAHSYEVEGMRCENLEVVVGHSPSRPVVVVGAHYDTVPGSPGADDNASGVAALLEVGRLLQDAALTHELRLVAFVNEEEPFFATNLQGSMVYANHARQSGLAIDFMISLEMLGCFSAEPGSQIYPPLLRYFYPESGNFIAIVSNLRSSLALRRFVNAFRQTSDFPAESLAAPPVVPGLDLSDHRSFWQHDFPAIMVTDTAFYRNERYHTALDTPDTVCYPELAQVTLGVATALSSLGAKA